MKLKSLLALMMITITISPNLVLAQEVTFAEASLGSPPKDFEAMQTGPGARGQWQVVTDAEASGGRAVAQVNQDRTDSRFPLLVYKQTVPADVEVSTRMRPVAGKVDQAGGLVIRLQDPNNYYIVRANALEGNVRFYKVVGGKRQQLAGKKVLVASNRWQGLRLRAQGDRFTVWFNDQELFSTTDQTFSSAGKVAFWTKADSVTRFGSLNIKALQ